MIRHTSRRGRRRLSDSVRRRMRCEALEDRRLLATLVTPEFLVNDPTDGLQKTFAETRSVAGNDSGNYVVTYAGKGDGDVEGVYARRYDASSTPQGSPQLVNVTTQGNQDYPSVAMGAGGEFVIAWSGRGVDDDQVANSVNEDDNEGVFVRLYNNAGAPVSGEIQVNQSERSFQRRPVVAKANDGSFVVVWSGKSDDDDDVSSGADEDDERNIGVFARQFAADGTPLTDEFLVNTTTQGPQWKPDVAVGSDGRFVITWSGKGPDDAGGIFVQQYDASANPVGVETRVNTTTNGLQTLSSIAVDPANQFVIVWSGKGEVAGQEDSRGVFMQRFDQSGNPVGGEQRVNTITEFDQEDASISMAPSGAFTVTWTGLAQGGIGIRIHAQDYDAAGQKTGSEFVVSTSPEADQKHSSVAALGDRAYVVAWSGRGVGDPAGVFASTLLRPEEIPGGGLIVDNGDPGFAQTGGWIDVPGFGYEDDAIVQVGDSTPRQASWTFSGLPSGLYDVSMTWLGGSDRDASVPVAIRDGVGGPIVAVVPLDQRPAPVGEEIGGRPFQFLDRIPIASGQAVVEISNDGVSGAVIADAVLLRSFTPLPATPEITVRKDLVNIGDGTTVTFSEALIGESSTHDFVVLNDGTADLVVQPVAVSGAGFTITNNLAAGTAIPPGGQATFTVDVDTSSAGTFNGGLSFDNNDGDEDPFDVGLSIEIIDPTTLARFIDDGDPGFAVNGGWVNVPGFGFDSDAKILTSNRSGDASWTFTGLAAGDYQVSATWLNGGDRTSNAAYVIRDGVGGPILATVPVNQRKAASGAIYGGRPFTSFGTFTVTGDTLVVEVDNPGADGHLIADAIRAEPLAATPDTPEITVTEGAFTVLDGGDVDFGSAEEGDPALSRLFTVENTGTGDIILQPIVLGGSGFSLASPNFVPNQVLPPAAQVTFTVELSTASAGDFSGNVTFANNDADENPFNFDLRGTIDPPAALVRIIDDGDAGFSSVGNFAPVLGYGFDGDALAGNGINGVETAQWEFSGLDVASSHDVAVTWLPGNDREAAVTYVIRDGVGGAILGTVVVDQTQAPVGTASGGRPFQSLGVFTTATGTLVVELSTAGSTLAVIADAVRLTQQ